MSQMIMMKKKKSNRYYIPKSQPRRRLNLREIRILLNLFPITSNNLSSSPTFQLLSMNTKKTGIKVRLWDELIIEE